MAELYHMLLEPRVLHENKPLPSRGSRISVAILQKKCAAFVRHLPDSYQ